MSTVDCIQPNNVKSTYIFNKKVASSISLLSLHCGQCLLTGMQSITAFSAGRLMLVHHYRDVTNQNHALGQEPSLRNKNSLTNSPLNHLHCKKMYGKHNKIFSDNKGQYLENSTSSLILISQYLFVETFQRNPTSRALMSIYINIYLLKYGC